LVAGERDDDLVVFETGHELGRLDAGMSRGGPFAFVRHSDALVKAASASASRAK